MFVQQSNVGYSGGVTESPTDALEAALCALVGVVQEAGSVVERAVLCDVVVRRFQALRAELVAPLAGDTAAVAELATCSGRSSGEAVREVRDAALLVAHPVLLDAVASGLIGPGHALAGAKGLVGAPAELTDGLSRLVLIEQIDEHGPALTAARLGAACREVASRVDPEAYRVRHEKAVRSRSVVCVDAGDGMRRLTATLRADHAALVADALATVALKGWAGTSKGYDRTTGLDGAGRSLDARRADALVEAVTGQAPFGHPSLLAGLAEARAAGRLVTHLHLTASLESLLGLTQTPVLVDGGGDLPVAVLREYARKVGLLDASGGVHPRASSRRGSKAGGWDLTVTGPDGRMLTSPVTAVAASTEPVVRAHGGVLPAGARTSAVLVARAADTPVSEGPSEGSSSTIDTGWWARLLPGDDLDDEPAVYQPRRLRRYAMRRDKHCRFPGCYVPAHQCEVDHFVPWHRKGRSVRRNVVCLCATHHRGVKHSGTWHLTGDPETELVWHLPGGSTQRTRPAVQHAEHPLGGGP